MMSMPDFREDREMVLAAVTGDGMALKHVPFTMQDEEVVTAAVSNCGLALQYAPSCFRCSEEIVSQAIARTPFALEYASEGLRADRNVVLSAMLFRAAPLAYAAVDLQVAIKKEAAEADVGLQRFAEQSLKCKILVVSAADCVHSAEDFVAEAYGIDGSLEADICLPRAEASLCDLREALAKTLDLPMHSIRLMSVTGVMLQRDKAGMSLLDLLAE
eukprot:TRINITY_DN19865_c0_g1_i3.p1 TRINITY_DN19865_c0_g1~~TRINITY_DN19865_c0_g1_i3.p1  ORF type:complete len:216 (-),score=44.55 TRINITY_DN19865_c0_g1_i3:160-807(-)